jgi:hypothetical protein
MDKLYYWAIWGNWKFSSLRVSSHWIDFHLLSMYAIQYIQYYILIVSQKGKEIVTKRVETIRRLSVTFDSTSRTTKEAWKISILNLSFVSSFEPFLSVFTVFNIVVYSFLKREDITKLTVMIHVIHLNTFYEWIHFLFSFFQFCLFFLKNWKNVE